MNDKDFLKGMIAYKIINDSNKNSGGGGSGGGCGCGTIIFVVLVIALFGWLLRSCGIGSNSSRSSYATSASASSVVSSTYSAAFDSGICIVSGCSKPRKTGSLYCTDHTCHYPGCTKLVSAGKNCSKHQPKSTTTRASTKSTTSTRATTSGMKKDPYDISDYDDIDDFYDDWYDDFDGFDDAEAYWDEYH